MKNAAFWDVTPCGSYKSQRFERKYRLHHKVKRISKLGTTLAVISFISTLMMVAIYLSETSALTRATRLHITEDGIFLVLLSSIFK
jgi:hypothetical protein